VRNPKKCLRRLRNREEKRLRVQLRRATRHAPFLTRRLCWRTRSLIRGRDDDDEKFAVFLHVLARIFHSLTARKKSISTRLRLKSFFSSFLEMRNNFFFVPVARLINADNLSPRRITQSHKTADKLVNSRDFNYVFSG
jgi:hypothetical protein